MLRNRTVSGNCSSNRNSCDLNTWRLGWTEGELVERRKGDLAKVRLAQRLREETLVTPAWIAGRLHMGSVAYLNNRLYLPRKGGLNQVIIGHLFASEAGSSARRINERPARTSLCQFLCATPMKAHNLVVSAETNDHRRLLHVSPAAFQQLPRHGMPRQTGPALRPPRAIDHRRLGWPVHVIDVHPLLIPAVPPACFRRARSIRIRRFAAAAKKRASFKSDFHRPPGAATLHARAWAEAFGRRFPSHLGCGEFAQLSAHQRQQLVRGLAVAF